MIKKSELLLAAVIFAATPAIADNNRDSFKIRANDTIYLPIGLGCKVSFPSDDNVQPPWSNTATNGIFVLDTPLYPGPGLSMPWLAISDNSRCLFFRAKEIDFSALRFHITYNRRNNTLDVAAIDPANGKKKSLVSENLRGSWHSAATAYRTAWNNKHTLAPETGNVRQMGGILTAIVKQQNGETIWPYSRFGELADIAKKRGLDWIGLFGWTEHGHDNMYPKYAPDPAMGGVKGLKDGIKAIHERGIKVFLYANGQLQERGGTDYWTNAGKDARLIDASGNPQGEVWHKYIDSPAHQFDYACLTTQAWRKQMESVAVFSAEVGADGIIFDQLGTSGPRRCFAENHPHEKGSSVYHTDRAQMMMEILRAARLHNKDFVLLTEGLHDSLLPSVAAFHGWVKGTVPKQGLRYIEGGDAPPLDYPPFPGIFQYTFPELVCSVRVPAPAMPPMWANYAALLGLRLEIEVRYAADRRYVQSGIKPSEKDYGNVREKPLFEAMNAGSAQETATYMKSLVELQRKFEDVFVSGRYVDTEGFKLKGPKHLAARGFLGKSKFGVVVCNFGKESASPQIDVECAVFSGAYEPLAGKVNGNSPLAPGAIRFYLYDNKLKTAALPPVEWLETPSHSPLKLIENGELRFAIVGEFRNEDAVRGPEGQKLSPMSRNSVYLASRELVNAIRRLTGKSPLVCEPTDPRLAKIPYIIALGDTPQSRALGVSSKNLKPEGFEIRTFDRGVVIVGMDGFRNPEMYDKFNWRCSRITCNGTEWGAVDFSERVLGLRYFSVQDKDLWTFVPEKSDVTLLPAAWKDAPKYRFRGGRHEHKRTAISTDFFGGEAPNPITLAKAHPDKIETIFYRDENGRLWHDLKTYINNYFDITNPELADVIVGDFKDYFAKDGVGTYWGKTWAPSSRYIWFGQCDKHLKLQSERALRFPRENARNCDRESEVYGEFYRILGEKCLKEFPDHTLVLMAYSNYLLAPRRLKKLPENVHILACVGTPVNIRSKKYRDDVNGIYAGWNALMSKGRKCVPYTYDLGYQNSALIPQTIRGYFEGEFLKAVSEYTSQDLVYPCNHMHGRANYASSYLTYRCLWNPNFDVEAGLKDFFTKTCGDEAGRKLYSFYKILVDLWIERWIPEVETGLSCIPSPDYKRMYTKVYTEKDVLYLSDLLKEAEKALPNDIAFRKRFDNFAEPFKKLLLDILAYQHMKTPDIDVMHAETPVTLDGNPNEEAWNAAHSPEFKQAFVGADTKVVSPDCRLVWDKKGLYLGIKSPAPYKLGKGMWDGDSFELMIAGGNPLKPASLYQFVLCANGQYEDLFMPLDQPRSMDKSWTAEGAVYRCQTGKEGWTGELFLPWSIFREGSRYPGAVWKINLISNRHAGTLEYSSWSPTLNNNRNVNLYSRATFR